jgi:hypothetical protein
MSIRCFYSLCLLALLGGCKQRVLLEYKNKEYTDNKEQNKGYQARAVLVDVPVPLYTECFSISSDNVSPSDNIVLGYKSALPIAMIIGFYKKEMDILGWECIKIFEADDVVAIFQTPLRICVVVLKVNSQQQTDIHIYVGPKQIAESSSHQEMAQLSSFMIENDLLAFT